MSAATQSSTLETIDTLNSFLRGELSAVETYNQAIAKMGDNPIAALAENMDCHQLRVEALRREIISLGGKPDETSGAWGAFTELVEGGAALFGRTPALAALEAGEDRGLAQYRKDITKLTGSARLFIETEIITAQHRTHDRMSRVKRLEK